MNEEKKMKAVQLGILCVLLMFLFMVFLAYIELRKDPFKDKSCGEILQKWSDKKCYLYRSSQDQNLSKLNLSNQTYNGIFQ